MCVKGSAVILLFCKISPAHGCFKGPEGDIDDAYFGNFCRKIGNISRLQRARGGKVCGARRLREQKFGL